MAKVNLFDWTDILAHGCTPEFGYNWNELHEILVKHEFPPMYEARTREYHINEMKFKEKYNSNEYGMPKEVCNVIVGFMEKEGITEMTVE